MKLLHLPTRTVVEFGDDDIPPYGIFSHALGSRDHRAPSSPSASFDLFTSEQNGYPHLDALTEVLQSDVDYLWTDLVCVDRSSTADLDETVNGALQRLRNAAICVVYLDDLPSDTSASTAEDWAQCAYWKNAWTLQELILPRKVVIHDQDWMLRGNTTTAGLSGLLSEITNIPPNVFLNPETIFIMSLGLRFSWAADRLARRREDVAYSLAAVTDVTLTTHYGEGLERAFVRLQEEILRNTIDGSIFGWKSLDGDHRVRGILAQAPSEFGHFTFETGFQPWEFDGMVHSNSRGVLIDTFMSRVGSELLVNIGRPCDTPHYRGRMGIWVHDQDNHVGVRVEPATCTELRGSLFRATICLHRNVSWPRTMLTSPYQSTGSSPGAQDRGATWACPVVPRGPATTGEASRGNPGTESNHTHVPIDEYYEARVEMGVIHGGPTDEQMAYQEGQKHALSESPSPSTISQPTAERIQQRTSNDAIPSPRDIVENWMNASGADEGSTGDVMTPQEPGAEGLSPGMEAVQKYLGKQEEIKVLLLREFETWSAKTNYQRPPGDRLPPRTRLQTGDSSTRSKDAAAERQKIKSCTSHQYYHLACPFYLYNRHRYRGCLLHHDLDSIDDVIRHRSNHIEPFFCPVCLRLFPTKNARREHVGAKSCQIHPVVVPHGLNARQRHDILQFDQPHRDDVSRWRRIWHIVFPNGGSGTIPGPYLDAPRDVVVSLVRDYWATWGEDAVAEYLEGCGLLNWEDAHDVDGLEGFHDYVWSQMLEMVEEKAFDQEDQGWEDDSDSDMD